MFIRITNQKTNVNGTDKPFFVFTFYFLVGSSAPWLYARLVSVLA